MAVNNTMWVPPSTQKVQKNGSTPQTKRTKLNVALRSAFKAAVNRDRLHSLGPYIFQLCIVLLIASSILIGTSRLASVAVSTQTKLAQQAVQNQGKLVQQLIQEQEKLAKLQNLWQTHMLQQQGSLVDQGHEQILTAYLDSMSSLLASQDSPLKQNNPNSWGRTIAQTRTDAVLNALQADGIREGIIIQFLHDSNLISTANHNTKGPIILLNNNKLSGIVLTQATLTAINFDGTIMSGANLSSATLTSSSFRGATLTKANFKGADLSNADLSGAYLENADLSGANLKGANINGADMKNAKTTGVIW